MPKIEKIFLVSGALLILSAVACNEWIFAALIRLYGATLSPSEIISIRLFGLSLLIIGICMIRYRKSRISANIFLSLCSVSLVLLATESYLRLFNPQIARDNGHDGLFEYHSAFGWQFIPNKTGVFSLIGEDDSKIVINSAGMRDREYTLIKPNGKKRIVVMGDSMVSGLEVKQGEVFTEVMEDSLLTDVEALNFGVNGYGPVQEYFLLRDRAFKYNPDIVIMVVGIRNDFDDVTGIFDWDWGYQRPRMSFQRNQEVVFNNVPVPQPKIRNFIMFLKDKLPFLRLHLIKYVQERLYDKYSTEYMPSEIRLCRKECAAETKKAYDYMEAIIKKASSLCREKGIEFVVVLAPSIAQVYDEKYWFKIAKSYGIDNNMYDLYLPNKKLTRMCEESGIRFLDLTGAFKSYAVSGEESYYHQGPHWNRTGHFVAAKEIAGYLHKDKLL